jgi:alkylation response protein AidB-like acyl-CoA dehydrogenase
MDLDFTEEQEMLRETVRGVCERHCPLTTVRELEDDPVGYSPELWKQLANVGVPGITVPESYGGSELTALEAAIVHEELGRTLAPTPHFVSSILGAGALMRAGSEDQKRRWLPPIATGEAIVTPAWLEPDRGYGPSGVQLRAERDGHEYRLSGTKRHVVRESATWNCCSSTRRRPASRWRRR